MKLLAFVFALVVPLTLASQSSLAATGALFSGSGTGAETFRVQDAKGKTPVFRILDGGGSEKALAMGVIATLNAQDEVQPKIPMTDFVDLKVETLKFEPLSKTSKDLAVIVKLSGYEIELKETIDREKFVSGKAIEVKYPEREKTIAMFNIASSGSLKMRLDPKTQILFLDDVRAKLNYDSPLGDSGTENIQFKGRGIRELTQLPVTVGH